MRRQVEALCEVDQRRSTDPCKIGLGLTIQGDPDRLVHVEFILEVIVLGQRSFLFANLLRNFLGTCFSMFVRQHNQKTDIFGFRELSPYAVNIHYPLSWIVMTQNLCVEFAEAVRLLFGDLITSQKGGDLITEAVISLLISLSIC